MHQRTPSLLRDIRRESTLRHRTAVLHNKYEGETAFVFSCGPSLSDVWSDKVLAGLDGRFTVAVKAAYKKVRELQPDMYWFNPIRIPKLDCPCNPDTIRVSSSNPTNPHNLDLFHHGCDLFYPLDVTTPDRTLLATHAFDTAVLPPPGNLVPLRPWGAGILLDMGLFILMYMGFKRIIVVGWDMGKESYTHFYDQENLIDSESIRVESEYSQRAAPVLVSWMAKKGVELRLCSPQSVLSIPQVSVDQMLEL